MRIDLTQFTKEYITVSVLAHKNSKRETDTVGFRPFVANTALFKSTIWDIVKHNEFPSPIKISAKVTVWVESEIDSWIDTLIANARGDKS